MTTTATVAHHPRATKTRAAADHHAMTKGAADRAATTKVVAVHHHPQMFDVTIDEMTAEMTVDAATIAVPADKNMVDKIMADRMTAAGTIVIVNRHHRRHTTTATIKTDRSRPTTIAIINRHRATTATKITTAAIAQAITPRRPMDRMGQADNRARDQAGRIMDLSRFGHKVRRRHTTTATIKTDRSRPTTIAIINRHRVTTATKITIAAIAQAIIPRRPMDRMGQADNRVQDRAGRIMASLRAGHKVHRPRHRVLKSCLAALTRTAMAC